MRHLLDTQALIWYVDQDHLLSPVAHAAMTDPANELLLSAATIWEIAIKVGLKKLALALPYRQWMERAVSDLELIVLPITIEHADVQASLPSQSSKPPSRPVRPPP